MDEDRELASAVTDVFCAFRGNAFRLEGERRFKGVALHLEQVFVNDDEAKRGVARLMTNCCGRLFGTQ